MEKKQNKKRLFFWHFILWIFFIIALYLSYGVYFVNITSTKSKWVLLFAGAIALLYSSCKILEMTFYRNDLKETSDEIEKSSKLYLHFLSYKTLLSFFAALIISVLLYYFIGYCYGICFFTGFLAC